MPDAAHIYTIIEDAPYRAAVAAGVLNHPSLDTAGFVHASPVDKLTRVANVYFAAAPELLVMVIAVARLRSPVKWEPASGSIYPHIYGPVNMDAVDHVVRVSPRADGAYVITVADLDRSRAIG